MKDKNSASPSKWLVWFDPRRNKAGTFAFVLNRITGLGLVFYLFLHLVVLGRLAQGPRAYNSFIALMKQPVYILLELLVVLAGIYHGLNGIRIVITTFSETSRIQTSLFYFSVILTILAGLFFAVYMFGAG